MGRVSRKTARLTVDHLAELADPVRACLFWELTPVDRSRLDEHERVLLAQRVFPLIEMMEASHKAGKDVTWGV